MVFVKTISRSELKLETSAVFGFLGLNEDAGQGLEHTVNDAIAEARPLITPRACYEEYEIKADGSSLDLGFSKIFSRDLAARLTGCKKIILIAATVGLGIDRLLSKYSVTEPSRALVIQAIGSAAIEEWLDVLCMNIGEGRTCRTRFSCGYGDLPLELQRDIFTALECEKHIGLTLNSSMLMTPTKSVTAIIGVE